MRVPNLEALIEESEKASMEEDHLTQQAEYMDWATEHLRVAERALEQIGDPSQYWDTQKKVIPGRSSNPVVGTTWVYTADSTNNYSSDNHWVSQSIPNAIKAPVLKTKPVSLSAPLIEHSVRYIK